MKVVLSLVLAFVLVCTAAPPIYAEPRQVLQGTEIHLTLTHSDQFFSLQGRRSLRRRPRSAGCVR